MKPHAEHDAVGQVAEGYLTTSGQGMRLYFQPGLSGSLRQPDLQITDAYYF